MAAKKVYQFKVTLRGIRPPIWRRFQVYSDISFYQFHHILLDVMGWFGGHLYAFDLHGLIVTDAETLRHTGEDGVVDSTRISKFVDEEGQKFRYEYDFGDSWEHDLLLEKILSPEPDAQYPRCLKGKRACPPEDVGGIWGYEAFLEAIADENHPEHEMYLDWVGDEFDPEEFDLEAINQQLSAE
jgi:hypothetical protein